MQELGTDIASYKLPIVDVQSQRRNFPGYGEAQHYSLDEIRMGDQSGTTETDSSTAADSGGYSTINKKSGPTSRWNSKRS